MKPILVLAFLCFIGTATVNGVSKRVLDLISIVSGDYDNRNQTPQAGDDHDFTQTRAMPVDIECLRPDPVMLLEVADNGIVRLLVLLVFTDGIEDTVNMTIYTFTDPAKHKPRDYNPGNFSNIKCKDLQTKPGCYSSFRVVAKEGFVFGSLPYCGAKIGGEYPRYTCNHLCHSYSSTFPMGLQQLSPIEPYELMLTSRKFPLINPPADYVSPCDKTNNNITDMTTYEPSSAQSESNN